MLVKCIACNGKGHKHLDFFGGLDYECDVCKGKGKIQIPENKKVCPTCKGRGLLFVSSNSRYDVEVTCSNCSGKGYIDK